MVAWLAATGLRWSFAANETLLEAVESRFVAIQLRNLKS